MKEERVYLLHIRDAIERIESYTTAGRDGFLTEAMVQDAVIRNLEIIGGGLTGTVPLTGLSRASSGVPAHARGTHQRKAADFIIAASVAKG